MFRYMHAIATLSLLAFLSGCHLDGDRGARRHGGDGPDQARGPESQPGAHHGARHGAHPGGFAGRAQNQGPPPFVIPPAQMLLHPGPGVGGPGPGVMGGVGPASARREVQTSQVRFEGPLAEGKGMWVYWQISRDGQFSEDVRVTPGTLEFAQGAIYRLKLTHIVTHEDKTLYPTLEIGPSTPRTEAFLAHNKIPVKFTKSDFDEVAGGGNFVTKVIYLPYPEYQDLAVSGGVNALVSTRLDPGVDPIIEADRKGTILAIIRMGNKSLEPLGPGPAREKIKPMGFQAPGGQAVNAQAPNAMRPPGAPVPLYGRRSITPSYISGVTSAPYGMPYTGTPIGLPGPPHLPLGIPAGLRKHSITNHTEHHIPGPVSELQIHVKQMPGFRYPQPPNRMYIHERVTPGGSSAP